MPIYENESRTHHEDSNRWRGRGGAWGRDKHTWITVTQTKAAVSKSKQTERSNTGVFPFLLSTIFDMALRITHSHFDLISLILM